MDFNEYQKNSRKTAEYPNIGNKKEDNFLYPVLGLLGEAGEVAEKVKKLYRDDNGNLTPERKDLIKKELGDVLWYLAQISTELGFEFDDVAETNLEKLTLRQNKNLIHGDGDER